MKDHLDSGFAPSHEQNSSLEAGNILELGYLPLQEYQVSQSSDYCRGDLAISWHSVPHETS